MHVVQLKEFLMLVEQRQAAAPPVGGRQRTITNRTGLALVPLVQQAFEVLGSGIDLRQALLIAVPFLGPTRAGMQAGVFLATQRGGKRKLAVEFDGNGLMIIGADNGAAAPVAKVGLQADTKRKRHQQNGADDEKNYGKCREHGSTSRQRQRV